MSPTPESRLPLIDPTTVTDPTVRAVYDEIERELGFGIVPNVFRAMGEQPAVLRGLEPLPCDGITGAAPAHGQRNDRHRRVGGQQGVERAKLRPGAK